MDRETWLLLALGMLITASAVVGVTGWVHFARDHHLAKVAHAGGAEVGHPEAHEER